jgi:uncharacterized RDD family membrane protein YckC
MDEKIQMNQSSSLVFQRSLAALIDYVIYFAILFIYSYFRGNITTLEGNLILYFFQSLPGFFIMIFVWILYFPLIESSLGYTLGKGLLDLEVVLENKKDYAFVVSLKRHLLDPIDFFLFGIPAIFLIMTTDEHKRVGDMFAHSRVMREGEKISMISILNETNPTLLMSIEYGGFWLRLGANIIDGIIFIPLGSIFIFFLLTGNLWLIISGQVLIATVSASYATVLHAKYGATI